MSPRVRLVLIVVVGAALAHPAVQSPFFSGPEPRDIEAAVEYRWTRGSSPINVEAKCSRPLTERTFRCDLVDFYAPGVNEPSRDIRLAVRVHPSAGWK